MKNGIPYLQPEMFFTYHQEQVVCLRMWFVQRYEKED